MDTEQLEEWYALQRQAVDRLRKGNTPARRGVRQLLQILVLPSFKSPVIWEVCEDEKAANRYFIVHSVWHKMTDAAKLETPVVRLRYPRPLVPTIEVRQQPLETEWAEATLTALQSLVIPVMVESRGIGLDGTSYEVAFDAGMVQAVYRWWEEPPVGWRPLHAWLLETVEKLEALTAFSGEA